MAVVSKVLAASRARKKSHFTQKDGEKFDGSSICVMAAMRLLYFFLALALLLPF